MSETDALRAERVPTVYFIDDSATMREVIKIAFRRESINVITCHDAASALAQFAENVPDAVITDVIMPDKDGYEVCQFIKQNSHLRKTPVILMSGIVNRAVAEKAIAAQADELIRKPFQPQELVARVKNLLYPPAAQTPPAPEIAPDENFPQPSPALSGIFAAPAPTVSAGPARPGRAVATKSAGSPAAVQRPTAPASPARANGNIPAEIQKLRSEIRRLEMLVKKLQSELAAERQYVASLEEHVKTLEETE